MIYIGSNFKGFTPGSMPYYNFRIPLLNFRRPPLDLATPKIGVGVRHGWVLPGPHKMRRAVWSPYPSGPQPSRLPTGGLPNVATGVACSFVNEYYPLTNDDMNTTKRYNQHILEPCGQPRHTSLRSLFNRATTSTHAHQGTYMKVPHQSTYYVIHST